MSSSQEHRLYPTLENLFRKVALGGVRNHGHYALPGSQAFGYFDGGINIGAGTRSPEHAFAGSQFLHHVKCLDIGHHHHFVADGPVEITRDKSVADSFHLVWTRLASAEDRSLRLYCDR